MFFPDPSCTANETIQKIFNHGIYGLIGADWIAIATISFRGNVFIDAWKDLNHLDPSIPLSFLEEQKYNLTEGAAIENVVYRGIYMLVIRFRTSERYACYNIYSRKDGPFEAKDIVWLKNYSRANLEITRLNNENIQNREYIDTVFNSVTSSILALRPDGYIILANQCAKETFGLQQRVGEEINFFELLDGDAQKRLFDATTQVMSQRDGSAQSKQLIYSEMRNQMFHVILSPLRDSKENISGVVLIADDITQQKMTELELEQLKQFGLLGNIAAGLAHDIKNPLMNILGCARIAAKEECAPHTKDEMMHMIQYSANRINQVVEQRLSYGRLNQQSDTMVDVNAVIRACVTMVERQKLGRVIPITTELDDSLPRLRASDIHVQQIFLNVLLNALQAIEHSGEIQVSSGYGDISRAIQVVVRDSGGGIPEEMRGKIFNPFFTTKNDGTGLGLFIVKQTLALYKGGIEISSEEGRGTECRITIPLTG